MIKLLLAALILLAAPAQSGAAGLDEELRGKLLRLDPATGTTVRYALPESALPEYYLIYFSAHWCAPCRRMTPALVGFYSELKASHPEVELVFVSADRDEGAMLRYLRWAEMPWPVLAWSERESVTRIAELRPRAIPYMAMFDRDGHLLGASDTGGFNVGIPKLLNSLQERLGMEIYDVHERHGKKSPLILTAYVLAGVAALVILVRKRGRRRG
jgi:thiol-disulfide isomerase/thioredoxin